MKLIRFGEAGRERPGVLRADGVRIDVSGSGVDYDEEFFGDDGPARLERWLAGDGRRAPTVPADARLGAPLCRPSKIICIGLNYRDHARETGAAIPAEPIIFFKSTTALCGPDDDVVIPRGGTKTDWEVELAVIIGRRATYVERADAMRHVAGYALHNDYSERAFQLERGGQWVKGKSSATFNPCGPELVTPDELGDIGDLDLWLDVDGVRRQTGNTAHMIFSPAYLVHYLSQFMVLEPGDLINTGTPPGVAMGIVPPPWLHAGQVMTLGISGLGDQRQLVTAAEAPENVA